MIDAARVPAYDRNGVGRAVGQSRQRDGGGHERLRSVGSVVQFEFVVGKFHLNSKLRFLTFDKDEPIKLSPKENELLKMLVLHENDLMPRELALTKIWRDDNYFTSRSMDVYIAKLRKYLKLDENVEILNIHGEGFRLVVKNKVVPVEQV